MNASCSQLLPYDPGLGVVVVVVTLYRPPGVISHSRSDPGFVTSFGRLEALLSVVRTVVPRGVTRTERRDSGTLSSVVSRSRCVMAPVAGSTVNVRWYVCPSPASCASLPISSAEVATSCTCWYIVLEQSTPSFSPDTRMNVWTSTSYSPPLVSLTSTLDPVSPEE